MQSPPPHRAPASPLQQHLDRRIARHFFAGGAAVSFGGALVYGLFPLTLRPGMRPVLAGGCLLLCAMFVWLRARTEALTLNRGVLIGAWGGCAMTGLAAYALGSGVHSQVLGYWALLVAVVAVPIVVRTVHGSYSGTASPYGNPPSSVPGYLDVNATGMTTWSGTNTDS